MKAKIFVLILLAAFAFATSPARAATNEISGLLQKGLFEEEANRNLEAAISAYQAVITQTDKDHQFAATAVFRLGECYRKLGRTNEANVQYQRILREFADQPELVKLSRQQVGRPAGNGLGELFETGRKIAAAQEEFDTAQRQLNELTGLPPEKLRIAVQQNHPNPVLDSLMQKMVDAERGLVRLKSDFGPDAPLVKTSAADFENIQRQIDEQVSGVTNGLMVKMQMAQKTLQTLGAPNTRPASNSGTTEPSNTEADEVRRFQNLIRDNPDLVNAKDGLGNTPLIHAARTNALEIAHFLLANGADVNSQGALGRTPLHLAAQAGNKEMVELLMAKGANLNIAESDSRQTPLHLATLAGFKSIVDLLLNNKAEVNAKNWAGKTAMDMAVQSGFMAIAESLLAHGADVASRTGPNSDGETPLDLAAAGGKIAMMELLITNRADINAKAPDGETALHVAARSGQLESAKWLIAHGANIDAALTGANNAGTTALHLAVAQNQNDLIRLLLESGANPNLPSKYQLQGFVYAGYTALQIAVYRNQPESAALLLQHKANVDAQDANGQTPLSLAESMGSGEKREELVKLLKDAGANDNMRRMRYIVVSRDRANYSKNIFTKGTNDLNRYNLYELLDAAFSVYPESGGDINTGGSGNPLAFPDLTRVKISRLNPKTGSEEVLNLDLETAIQSGDCSKNIWLEWGDVVEIPALDHNLNEKWYGYPKAVADGIYKCLARQVEIICKGQSGSDNIGREFIGVGPGPYTARGVLNPQWWLPAEPHFRLRDVIYRANVLLASSDTTRVKVRRVDPETKKVVELVFDLGKVDPNTDLWLRDGDVIEIPEK